MGRLNNIVAGGEQVDLVDALLADLSDAVPLIGDVFSGVRTAQILSKPGVQHREQKATLMAIDTAVGIIPVVGDIIDLLLPSNTIIYLVDKGALPRLPELPPLPALPRPEQLFRRS